MEPDKQGFFKDTQQLAEEYIRERLLLLKLETVEKSARIASVAFAGIIIGIFINIVLLLVSALGSYLLKELTGSWFYGIGIVVIFYLFVILLLIAFRKSLFHKNVSNFVIRLFFEKTENDAS